MPCRKETVKSSGLNIWSDEAAAESAPKVDIIAVQGLGAHPYYTWVKKTPTSKTPSWNINTPKRFRDKAKFWKTKRPEDEEDSSAGCMWLRDLLVPLLKNARVATYSYKSDWKDADVKTSLWKCAEQFLNTLIQRAYQANGQVKGAVAMLEQVVRIRGTTLAEDHPYRLASQHALAGAYEANG